MVQAPSYKVTAETLPFIKQYRDCLMPGGSITYYPESGKTQADQARARITVCTETRRWAVARAISVYKWETGGERNPATFANKTFDTIDQANLLNAEFGDKLMAGKIVLPADRTQPIVLKSDSPPDSNELVKEE